MLRWVWPLLNQHGILKTIFDYQVTCNHIQWRVMGGGVGVWMSALHIESPATALSPAFSVVQLEAIRPTAWE